MKNYDNRYKDENGDYHREDGPAFESDNFRAWWIHGKRHREDGPAMEWNDGGPNKWFLDNVEYSFEYWLRKVPVSNDKKMLLKLTYGGR